MSKPMPKPREPEAPAPAQVMPDEAITLIRASSAVDVRILPDVPAGFRATPPTPTPSRRCASGW